MEGHTLKCASHFKSLKDAQPGDGIMPPSTVYEDNAACLKFAMMTKLSLHTNHIAVPFYWFCSQIVNLEIFV
jgi:hypothetical protein